MVGRGNGFIFDTKNTNPHVLPPPPPQRILVDWQMVV